MGNFETYHGDSNDTPVPPEDDNQPNSGSQLSDIGNEVGKSLGERDYIVAWLVEEVETALANSRFHTVRRDQYSVAGCNIYNQQNEQLLIVTIGKHDFFYTVGGKAIYGIDEQEVQMFPPASEWEKGKSEKSYIREAAKKAAEVALKQAELIEAAIQKEKLDKKSGK